jgi:hypothetical protein
MVYYIGLESSSMTIQYGLACVSGIYWNQYFHPGWGWQCRLFYDSVCSCCYNFVDRWLGWFCEGKCRRKPPKVPLKCRKTTLGGSVATHVGSLNLTSSASDASAWWKQGEKDESKQRVEKDEWNDYWVASSVGGSLDRSMPDQFV